MKSPDPSAQAAGQSNPIGGPAQPKAPPGDVGPNFRLKGAGKYYNPSNVSGQQFNHPAIKQAVGNTLDKLQAAQYYRHAGLAEGMRGALGLPQRPSHTNDWINAKHRAETEGTRGINPGVFKDVDEEED